MSADPHDVEASAPIVDGHERVIAGPHRHPFVAALVRRPILLATLFTTLVVIGLIAWSRIPIQMMPDGIVDPGLEIFAANPGASAQENEERVARVLEEELRTLPSVKGIHSQSRAEDVGIFVEFDAKLDMNFAKAEVRDRIERARPKLPDTVQDVGIFSWSESDLPIMFFALKHPGDSPRTDFLVENVIQRHLESVDGVGKVDVWGLLEDSMRILLDEDRVRGANLDLGALIRRLRSDNFSLSMGEVQDGGRRLLLRADMRFRSPKEIEEYPIGNGLRIGDIGHVEMVKSVRESLFRIDGEYAYFVEVRKDAQANIVETCSRLEKELVELEKHPQLAGQFHFLPIFDQGEFIENSLKQLTDSAWEGGLLAVVVLFLFLWRFRQTLLVALSIPISVILAIAWCYFTGRSFNVLTMTGITLAMGMLVDNAIVVIENITRLKHSGLGARDAVVQGTGEVGLAVLLSTLTTVVVFLPMIFMTENPILRLMFGELGLPLCIALLISLVVALVFMPVATEWAIGERPAWLERIGTRISGVGALPGRITERGVAALRWSLRAARTGAWGLARGVLLVVVPLRWPLLAAVILLAGWRAWSARPWMERVAPVDPGNVLGLSIAPIEALYLGLLAASVVAAGVVLLLVLPRLRRRTAAAPIGPSAAAAAERSVPRAPRSLIEIVADTNHALVEWSLKRRLAASGAAFLCFLSVIWPIAKTEVAAFGEDDSKTQMRVYVDLEDNFSLAQASDEMAHYERFLDAKRAEYHLSRCGVRFSRTGGSLRLFWSAPQTKEHMEKVLADLHANLPKLSGHHLRFLDDVQPGADTRNKNVATFAIRGPDSEVLARLGAEAVRTLERVPGLTSVASPLENAPPQVQLSFDSDVAQKLSITPRAALENVAWALRGFSLPRYHEPGREVPLIIEYDGTEAAGLDTLRELEIWNGTSSVPLTSVARFEFGQGARTIWRENGQATFALQARVENSAQQKELTERGYAALEALDLPRGYSFAREDSVVSRQESEMAELKFAGLLSLFLVFLLMGILFESLLLPLSVLFTIPFAVVGSYWSLYLTGTAMDSIGWIGIIILVGVVVNNGIVLIDRVHELRRQGWERTAAVLEGCRNRVRPILMTALTSVMGLWPMATTEPPGESIDFRALATCVGGGLAISTIFTLWVVPLAYTVLDDLAHALAQQTKWSLRPRGVKRASAEADGYGVR
ncbi:MAG: efflux RND transporter permease subunit [Planctomycetes bacterium]|nr:efflux RND transporter permease subunit [Planctomycetota bacterium]